MNDLVTRATKGEPNALKALLEAGEGAMASGKFEEACVLLKEAASCYKLEAFRQRAHREAAEGHCSYLEVEIAALERLLAPLVPPLREGSEVPLGSVDDDALSPTAVIASSDPETRPLYALIERRMARDGFEFRSGASITRVMWWMLMRLVNGQPEFEYLRNPTILAAARVVASRAPRVSDELRASRNAGSAT